MEGFLPVKNLPNVLKGQTVMHVTVDEAANTVHLIFESGYIVRLTLAEDATVVEVDSLQG